MHVLYRVLNLRKCIRRWPYSFEFNVETFKFRSSSTISRTGFDNYEKARISWNVEIPENFNFAADVLDNWADKEKTGERSNLIPAFWFAFEDGRQLKWSFQDFQRETMRTACMLEKQCGLKKSDIVMVMLPKMPEFWLVNIAAIRIGFILSPGSMMLTAKDIAYRFSALKPSCIIAHETVVDLIDQVAVCCPSLKTKIVVSSTTRRNTGWLDFHSLYKNANANHKCAETKSNESMMVFFSSGTTGLPKMIEHSHRSYGIALAATGRYWLDLTRENILWNMSDTGWAKTAYSNIFAPWSCGACVFVHQMSRYSPDTALKILSQFPIDTLCAPPLAYRTMVQENITSHHFPKLTHCVSAGEALNPEIIRLWERATNLKIYEGYGQTETILLIGMFKCLDYKPGSIGKPVPGIDVVVRNNILSFLTQ
ncbi:acyl-coenzyme A synthetase ACSM3, mitochondrial-like isoform X1 [Stegodyphus dumicola]|uniref:acyl-coenzyme A synthetase ACSM3, mitochondrial-like isoform X1 n=2 Tax=Stegodyphus dumicola TaxID=202533 RepID=UPI0015B254FC|nr:acyl-coenzyme A synthetase ACSM3, mitochondrial-like isoform X1 [Stegodyphus dumicola]